MSELNEKTRRFVTLMGAYDQRLFSFILSLVPNFADAEELAQQVRLRLWEQFDEYDVTKDFGAWSRAIAHYLAMAHFKKSAKGHRHFSDATLDAIAEEASLASERDSDRKWAMQECLGKMDQSKRKLLVRYYSNGETLKEIAGQIGRSFDAVRHSVLRSRMALADCIERVLRREGV